MQVLKKRTHVFMNDKVSKKIFKNDDVGKELTARIVGGILHTDYKEIYDNLVPVSEEIGINKNIVNSETDILYQDDLAYINIEINSSKSPTKLIQTDVYTYQLLLRQIKSKKDYLNYKRIIQISIDNYDFFKRGDFIYEVGFIDKKYGILESNNIIKYHINLESIDEISYNEGEKKLKKLLYFLICDDVQELEDIYKGDRFMSEVLDKAKKVAGIEEVPLYLTDEERIELDKQFYINEGYEDGIKVGYDSGIKTGYDSAKIEMVINFYKNDVSLDVISKSSGLSINEIKKIIKEKN